MTDYGANGRAIVRAGTAVYGEPVTLRVCDRTGYKLRLEELSQRAGGEPMLRFTLEFATSRGVETTQSFVSVPRHGAYMNLDTLEWAAAIGDEERRLVEFVERQQRELGSRPLPPT